jgi:hypothetical protein
MTAESSSRLRDPRTTVGLDAVGVIQVTYQ